MVGYAPGAWDLFHLGHLNVLRHAAARCDYLIASVVDDDMLAHLERGRRGPATSSWARASPGATRSRGEAIAGIPVLGDVADVPHQVRVVHAHAVAVVGADSLTAGVVRDLGYRLESTGTDLIVAPGLVDVAGPRVVLSPAEGLSLVHVDAPQFSGARYVAKPALDRGLSLAAPGLTGLWQVSGRSDLSWEEGLRKDLYYVENWSLVGDVLILARTFRAVRRRTSSNGGRPRVVRRGASGARRPTHCGSSRVVPAPRRAMMAP